MTRYPIGNQDFKTIREEGYAYVDKTPFIARLLEESQYYFLSRPRRFGKSLFLSTLECFFRNERDLFKGLYIESYPYEWKEYPVLRINFAASNYQEQDSVEQSLNHFLSIHEEEIGLQSDGSLDIYTRFKRLISRIHQTQGNKVVVLVDEYEKPLTDTIDNTSALEQNRNILRGFYSVLKEYEEHIRFVFITGVTKFGQMNIFSGLNNLRDISMNNRYAAICGVTEEELMQNFREGIIKLGEKHGLGFDASVELLKKNYDGYHFSKDCPDIYNPFSLINSLADGEVENYWFRTATPSLLPEVLKKSDFQLSDLDGVTVSSDDIMGIDTWFDDPVPLFYQTGYLTLKSYDKKFNLYTLGYPNMEVEQSFFNYILPYYTKVGGRQSKTEMKKIIDAVTHGDPETLIKLLQSLTSGITYEVIDTPRSEKQFQNLLFIICKLLLPYTVKAEERTSNGRCDLLIESDRYVYIIEIKTDSTAVKALNQIKEKAYYRPYTSDYREVFLIGLNYSKTERCITQGEYERLRPER